MGILTFYPEFSRKQIEFDEAIMYELVSSAYPHGYQSCIQTEQPESKSQSAFQFGVDKRIYIQYLLFYEPMDAHVLSYLERRLALMIQEN